MYRESAGSPSRPAPGSFDEAYQAGRGLGMLFRDLFGDDSEEREAARRSEELRALQYQQQLEANRRAAAAAEFASRNGAPTEGDIEQARRRETYGGAPTSAGEAGAGRPVVASTSDAPSRASLPERLTAYEQTCADIGFKKGTVQYGECVVELVRRNR